MSSFARSPDMAAYIEADTQHAMPSAAKLVVWLLVIRWLAGVAENFGAAAVSEASAIAVLAALGGMFLFRMRVTADAALLVAGLLAWVLTAMVSYSANSVDAPQDAVSLLALLALYALFANAAVTHLRDTKALLPIRRFLAAFILLGMILSAHQLLSGSGFAEPEKPGVIRAFGSDVHPVSFAIQIVTVMVALEVVRVKLGSNFGIWHSCLLLLGAISLYLTYARTAWIMAFLTLAFVMIVRANRTMRWLVVFVFLLTVSILVQSADRFSDLGSLPTFLASFSFSDAVFDYRFIDNSLSWRMVNWAYGLQQAMQQPVLGFGPGQSAASSYFNLEMHNILLEIFFEGGIFGLGSFLIVLAGLIHIHRHLPNTTQTDRYVRTLTNGFGISLLLAVLFSTSFVDQLMSVLLYFLLLSVAGVETADTKPAPHPLML